MTAEPPRRIYTAAELEAMTPEERASLPSLQPLALDDLTPEFRARVIAKGRQIIEQYGLRPEA